MDDTAPSFRLAQQLWDQKVQANSRTHANVHSEQWDLLIENGNSHANAIMELMKDVSTMKSELNRQKGELKGCVNSVMLLDKRSMEQTERIIKEHHDKMAEGLDGIDRKHHSELENLEAHLVNLINTAIKTEQDARGSHVHEQVGRSERELRAELRGDQERHGSQLQGQLRQFEELLRREQETRAAASHELRESRDHSWALEAAVKEHNARVNGTQEELGRLQANLEQLRTVIAEQDTQLSRVSRELLAEIKQEHDKRVVQIRDELRQLDAAIKREQGVHAADVHEIRGQIKREREELAADVRAELRASAATKAHLAELEHKVSKLEEDLKNHWHNLSYTENFCCTRAELPHPLNNGDSQETSPVDSPERTRMQVRKTAIECGAVQFK